MHNLHRDIGRLELMLLDPVALESLSAITSIKQALGYFSNRFLTNLKHLFSKMATSEITDYHKRHTSAIKRFAEKKTPLSQTLIVPIPKGMVSGYKATLDSLGEVLTLCHASELDDTLEYLLDYLKYPDKRFHAGFSFPKVEYEKGKQILERCYSTSGPTHLTIRDVLSTRIEVSTVMGQLEQLTAQFYQQSFRLQEWVGKIEQAHAHAKLTQLEQQTLGQIFLSCGYRLSLFAVVMEHLQTLEHQFVQALDRILKHDIL